jgi:EAL domain-containing protein (putative c-di-GMP-specific phosphodiesterase class I)/tetratricopeptide (TPR) repeat protein
VNEQSTETSRSLWAPPVDAGAKRSTVFAGLARTRLEDDPEEAAKLALKSIDAARIEGDQHATAIGMLLLSRACQEAGNSPEEILRPVRYAIDQFIAQGDGRSLAEARLLQATLLFHQCAYDEAEFEVRSARDLAVACDDLHLVAMCDVRLATIFVEANGPDHAEYRQTFASAAAAFIKLGDQRNAARALFNLALTAVANDPREAVRVSAQALALLDDPRSSLVAVLHAARAEAAALLGWVSVAEGELEDIEAIHRASPLPPPDELALFTVRATVHRAAGRMEEAKAEYQRAQERARELGDHFFAISIAQSLIDLYELQGDFIGALSASRAHHDAYVRLKEEQASRRRAMFDLTGRLEAERRDAEHSRTAQFEMQRTVESARADLAQAEHQLELERSRRSLVELRASRDPGVEPRTGLPSLAAISGALAKLLDDLAQVAIVIVSIDDDRVAAPLHDDRQRLLQEMSARSHAYLKHVDGAFAGSLGSDDIVGVIPIHDGTDLDRLLSAWHLQLSRPIDLVDRVVSASVQLGVAIAPEHGIRANALLSRARLAAQAARQERPYSKSIAVFETAVEERQQLRSFVHEHLGTAIETEQIKVYFQPLVDAASGLTIGAEALVRWTDPERGAIPPSVFVPLAEETGHIVQLGGHVLTRACCEAAAWPSSPGIAELVVSVNVSAAQIAGGTVLEQVDAALLISGLPPHRLAIELTESTLARGTEVVSVLQTLRARGIMVEIDDFGTGYSSFGYLTRFPVDCVKIDKSFIDRIALSDDDAAITQAIITMAHSLRLTVVAEGVETEAQAEVLLAQGCDTFQGWLYAKALSADDFVGWLAARSVGRVLASS